MNIVFKSAATAALLGVVALASATPGEARYGRWAAAGAGVAVGTAVGVAAANRAYGAGYYRPGYYAYGSGYDAYASSGSVYTGPGYYRGGSFTSSPGCTTEGNYGQGIDESACNQ
jgi:hypothetical protein